MIGAFYGQMIAEELSARPEVIMLILGDTDRTPDGGYSAGFLFGAANVHKVAAYTYQALLGLAATQLNESVSCLVGTSYPMPGIPDKVTGKTQWSCDVTLPGMLHARMVRPATLGSRKGNLVAVLSQCEWEAITAAQSVAAGRKWTDWSELQACARAVDTAAEGVLDAIY